MTITIVGAGYVGLVTAAIFSSLGNKVYCVDTDEKKIKILNLGKTPFFEPGLSDYIKKAVMDGSLTFTSSYQEAVPKSQVAFICVGTPPKDNGEADLAYLFSALEETAKHLKGYTLIAIKSTIPIGFEDDLEATVKKFAKVKFDFASCPEFLREGTAIEDSFHPDRIVIGTNNKKAQKLLLELHAPLSGERVICDLRSAQLIKYASNSFLATKISFANAVANICEKTGADAKLVLKGVGLDRRIGSTFLNFGIGYGGSCLPKDVLAFIAQAKQFDYDFDLMRAVDAINTGQIYIFVNKIREALNAKEESAVNLENFKIAVLGLAFKGNTDDIREAPSIKIIDKLLKLGAKITAFDPQAMENAKKVLPQISYAKNIYQAVEEKDAVVVVTDWPEFATMDLQKIKKLVKKPIIVDGRNIFDSQQMKDLGFEYFTLGR